MDATKWSCADEQINLGQTRIEQKQSWTSLDPIDALLQNISL